MENISPFIKFFMFQGVPFETIILILMLPIIATLIALLRQVVGIKAFGLYTPLIVTFAFLATNGLKYGLIIFALVIISGIITRFVLKPFRLLFLPRVAIMVAIVAFFILIMLVVGGSLKRTGLAAVSIFPILIMITIVEKFITVQIEKGTKTAIVLAIETLIISVLGFFMASWDILIRLLAAYPWVALLTIPLNIVLGKWTGLRVQEYFRFKEVLKKL